MTDETPITWQVKARGYRPRVEIVCGKCGLRFEANAWPALFPFLCEAYEMAGKPDPTELARTAEELAKCPGCGFEVTLRGEGFAPPPRSGIFPGAGVGSCLACGCPDLHRQKDFPRKVGLAVAGLAAVLVFVAVARRLPFWAIYAPLLAAAAVDAALYLSLPEIFVCYRCGAKHRGFAREPRPEPFDPAIHDRHRFGKPAVPGP